MCVYIYEHVNVCECMCMSVCECVCMYMSVCMCEGMWVWVYLCVCESVCIYVAVSMCCMGVKIREQPARDGNFLPPCQAGGWNSSCCPWQAPLCPELFHWPLLLVFFFFF